MSQNTKLASAGEDTWFSVSFAVQFFNFYVYRGRINKRYLGGLAKTFKIRNRHHQMRFQILRLNEGLILILAQSQKFSLFLLCIVSFLDNKKAFKGVHKVLSGF